jgi:hypothetical protein
MSQFTPLPSSHRQQKACAWPVGGQDSRPGTSSPTSCLHVLADMLAGWLWHHCLALLGQPEQIPQVGLQQPRFIFPQSWRPEVPDGGVHRMGSSQTSVLAFLTCLNVIIPLCVHACGVFLLLSLS